MSKISNKENDVMCFRKRKLKDRFLGVSGHLSLESYIATVKFKSCELNISVKGFLPVIEINKVDLDYLTPECKLFSLGEFKGLPSVNFLDYLKDIGKVNMKVDTSITIILLENYLIDVKIFRTTMLVKVYNKSGIRVDSITIESIFNSGDKGLNKVV